MRQPLNCAVLISILSSLSTAAHGQLAYNFTSDAGPVLATIEFTQLPGDHNDVASLIFTAAGDEVFGFGSEYLGTFDRMGQDTIGFMDEEGMLVGANFDLGFGADMHDDDPPESSLAGVQTTTRFTIDANNVINPPNVDRMILEYVDTAGMPQTINQFGSWFVVPEPDSMVAATLAALAVSGFVTARRLALKVM
jgi:hypothetical protein